MRTFSPRRLLGSVLRNTVTFCWGKQVFRRKLFSGVASVVAGLLVDPAPRRVFDIACLNEQSRNNDGHGGSSDGVLWDYPTVYCEIL